MFNVAAREKVVIDKDDLFVIRDVLRNHEELLGWLEKTYAGETIGDRAVQRMIFQYRNPATQAFNAAHAALSP